MFPISAKKLLQGRVQTLEGRKEGVTVLPLFTASGEVKQLVIVTQKPGKISLVDWEPGLVFKPWIGPLVLNLRLSQLAATEAEEARLATKFWHFDPWWLLDGGDLAQNQATPNLKVTNVIAVEKHLKGMMFSSDLSKVSWVTEPTKEGVRYRHLLAEPLPKPTMVPASKRKELARSGGWVLKPFWER